MNEYFFHCLFDSCLLIAPYRSVIISLADIFNNITTLKSILRWREKPFVNISLKQPAVIFPVMRKNFGHCITVTRKKQAITCQ